MGRSSYLGEGSYPLSQLCFHLRQSLCLSDGLLQLLLSQLQFLLELPVSVLSLQQTKQKQTVISEHVKDSVLHPGLGVCIQLHKVKRVARNKPVGQGKRERETKAEGMGKGGVDRK